MCTYKLADSVGTGKKAYAMSIRIIRVPSSSRITSKLILQSFALGADGVFIGDCEANSTPYSGSIEFTQKNIKSSKALLKEAGINPERLMFFPFATVMIPKFVQLMNLIDKTASGDDVITDNQRDKINTTMNNLFKGEK